MPRKYLVALDDSPYSESVFAKAVTLAEREGAKLMLVHVLSTDERDNSPLTRLIPYHSAVGHDALIQQYYVQQEIAEKNGLETLNYFAETAQEHGIPVEFSQPIGNPRSIICQLAQAWKADLIIMGRRKHSWFSQWWLGSISKYVSCHAPCPVEIIQPG